MEGVGEIVPAGDGDISGEGVMEGSIETVGVGDALSVGLGEIEGVGIGEGSSDGDGENEGEGMGEGISVGPIVGDGL